MKTHRLIIQLFIPVNPGVIQPGIGQQPQNLAAQEGGSPEFNFESEKEP